MTSKEYDMAKANINSRIPVSADVVCELEGLLSAYDGAVKAEMCKPAQLVDIAYAMFMRENASEVRKLLDSAIIS